MKRKIIFLSLCFLTVSVFSGCGDNHRLTGKVTFTDGKPAPCGMVIFSTDSFQARGNINSDGTYSLSSVKAGDGIPPGEYKVFVSGIDKRNDGQQGMGSFVPLCDTKYQNAQTSGLTCTIPAPKNKYDIVLDPHPKNYP